MKFQNFSSLKYLILLGALIFSLILGACGKSGKSPSNNNRYGQNYNNFYNGPSSNTNTNANSWSTSCPAGQKRFNLSGTMDASGDITSRSNHVSPGGSSVYQNNKTGNRVVLQYNGNNGATIIADVCVDTTAEMCTMDSLYVRDFNNSTFTGTLIVYCIDQTRIPIQLL